MLCTTLYVPNRVGIPTCSSCMELADFGVTLLMIQLPTGLRSVSPTTNGLGVMSFFAVLSGTISAMKTANTAFNYPASDFVFILALLDIYFCSLC